MENNYYQIYVDNVRQLASSIVIKSEDTAEAINNDLYVKYGPSAVNKYDQTTWRYYLNISGQYHAVDQMMTVVSLDTLETINFTRENLEFHTNTVKAYEYGSRNYKELLNRYPNQERLILGILYPVDINIAIEAPNGQILSYPPILVEEHEYSLIPKLQERVNGYLSRWDNSQFKLSDNLYTATILGIMYINLVPAILNIRLKACKTNETHTYHIRQYLASHGMLDSYMTYLTRKQMLFLYRNMNYIYRNSGKTHVFEWLMQHIMTDRGLPLAAYQMRHDLTNQPTELRPLVGFRKKPLNTNYNYDQKNVYSTNEVLVKENPLARDNVSYIDYYQSKTVSLMQNSLSNKQSTKLLESTMIDYSGSEHYTLADTLLYHWMYLSNKDIYTAYINIEAPSSGEVMSLRARKAFELYIYVYCKINGIVLTHLPKIIAKRVLRTPKASLSQVMSVVNPDRVPISFAQEMSNLIPAFENLVTVDGFYKWCKTTHTASLTQYYRVCREEFKEARAQKHALISRFWTDAGIQLGTEDQTYDEWFQEMNIDISSYSSGDLISLSKEILNKATGVESGNIITIKQIQAAMVKLMGQLGSYSVQYSVVINELPILDAPCPTVRPDDFIFMMEYGKEVLINVSTLKSGYEYQNAQQYSLNHEYVKLELSNELRSSHKLNSNLDVKQSDHGTVHSYRQIMPLSISYELPVVTNNDRDVTVVLGIDTYLSRTLEEQMTLPDIWHLNRV